MRTPENGIYGGQKCQVVDPHRCDKTCLTSWCNVPIEEQEAPIRAPSGETVMGRGRYLVSEICLGERS